MNPKANTRVLTRRSRWFAAGTIGLMASFSSIAATELKTQNVFLLTADGLRWQEVFRGPEDLPLTREFGNFGNSNAIRKDFWRETPAARREALFVRRWS